MNSAYMPDARFMCNDEIHGRTGTEFIYIVCIYAISLVYADELRHKDKDHTIFTNSKLCFITTSSTSTFMKWTTTGNYDVVVVLKSNYKNTNYPIAYK